MFPLVEEIGIEKKIYYFFFFGVIKCLEHIEGLNLLQVFVVKYSEMGNHSIQKLKQYKKNIYINAE